MVLSTVDDVVINVDGERLIKEPEDTFLNDVLDEIIEKECLDATEDEIKSAYRRLSLKYHPDRNVDKSISEQKEAERKFKEIVAAKRYLDNIS